MLKMEKFVITCKNCGGINVQVDCYVETDNCEFDYCAHDAVLDITCKDCKEIE